MTQEDRINDPRAETLQGEQEVVLDSGGLPLEAEGQAQEETYEQTPDPNALQAAGVRVDTPHDAPGTIATPSQGGEVATAPPPIEAPPIQESLAEQVYRETHTIPVSTGPSDVVPNRPNIRPPGLEVETEQTGEVVAGPMGEEVPTEQVTIEHQAQPPQTGFVEAQPLEDQTQPARATAADLIARAEAADSEEELDEIEAQADGRVTVLNAVEARRAQL